MKRLLFFVSLALVVVLAACAPVGEEQAATEGREAKEIVVYASPLCGCCHDWVAYLEEHGYTVSVEYRDDLAPVKRQHAVPATLTSCHTAIIDGYVVEGHVPVEALERLLEEAPDVAGIAVAGMPIGSPGMEVEGAAPQPFDVVAFDGEGNVSVVGSYGEN